MENKSAAWVAERVSDRSARGIAASVGEMVRSGDLEPGMRMPTVRSLALALAVSPGTVAQAWSALRRSRVITARGRAGTVVIGRPEPPTPARFEGVGRFGSRLALDLSLSSPDPSLLPPLCDALRAGVADGELNEYTRVPITDQLRAAVEPSWPFSADSWLAVNGGFEGLWLLCQAMTVRGPRIAVENPTAPRVLDILDGVNAEVVPVGCDDEGPVPEDVAAAISQRCVAFLYQPRTQAPCGHAVTNARAERLAGVLVGSGVTVIEDEGQPELSTEPPVSLGSRLPGQTVLVRSYSKSHGPDLRLGVLAGAEEVVNSARRLRMFGSGWSSRILQNALAYMLTDSDCQAAVADARTRYAKRRELLAAGLRRHGVETRNRDGLALWVPVSDEQSALVTLAASGIAATPGSRFQVVQNPARPHLRVSVGRLDRDFDWVAERLADAASGSES